MRLKRTLLACLVALGIAPGTCVRSELPDRDYRSPAKIAELEFAPMTSGPLRLEGTWQIDSENHYFGGWSSLVARSDGHFITANDIGRLMTFPRPDREIGNIIIEPFVATRGPDKKDVDVEALAIDPGTGNIWAGLERSNEIIALGNRLEGRESIRPSAMKGWAKNAGPEAMARLADGRFIVIEESTSGSGEHDAVLFTADPLAGGRPVPFTFQARDGFRPSGAAALPDGRFAVLLRGVEWAYPPRFPVQIVVADPDKIEEGTLLETSLLARIEAPMPSDNYEGISVIDEGDGTWTVWLISDDNFTHFQRTLLLKLRWEKPLVGARQKARR